MSTSARATSDVIGHERVGTGASVVVILNDWIGDTTTWYGARPYLDLTRFTYVFADLRGYGRSMGRAGMFTVEEAASDVIALADALAVERFSIVGHSMSSLVALHLGQHSPDRIARAVVLCPPPPGGFGADDARLESQKAVARGDDAQRAERLKMMWGDRLSDQWIAFKAARWRACADPEAVAGYVAMFAQRGLPDPKRTIAAPLLAVTGEQDFEVMRSAAAKTFLAPLATQLSVMGLKDCGHYPMQEAPPLLVTIVERFLAGFDVARAPASE